MHNMNTNGNDDTSIPLFQHLRCQSNITLTCDWNNDGNNNNNSVNNKSKCGAFNNRLNPIGSKPI